MENNAKKATEKIIEKMNTKLDELNTRIETKQRKAEERQFKGFKRIFSTIFSSSMTCI